MVDTVINLRRRNGERELDLSPTTDPGDAHYRQCDMNAARMGLIRRTQAHPRLSDRGARVGFRMLNFHLEDRPERELRFGKIFIRQSELAERMGKSIDYVKRGIRELKRLGFLIVKQERRGKNTLNTYLPNWQLLAEPEFQQGKSAPLKAIEGGKSARSEGGKSAPPTYPQGYLSSKSRLNSPIKGSDDVKVSACVIRIEEVKRASTIGITGSDPGKADQPISAAQREREIAEKRERDYHEHAAREIAAGRFA